MGPHWPHAQPLISPRGRRHEPLGEKPGKPSSRPSFHQIVTDTSLGSRVVDNLVNFVFPDPPTATLRRVDGKKLQATELNCYDEVKHKSYMNWMDSKLQCVRDFSENTNTGEAFVAKAYFTRNKADLGKLCTCKADKPCQIESDYSCDA